MNVEHTDYPYTTLTTVGDDYLCEGLAQIGQVEALALESMLGKAIKEATCKNNPEELLNLAMSVARETLESFRDIRKAQAIFNGHIKPIAIEAD